MNKKIILLMSCTFSLICTDEFIPDGYCNVPVADLIGAPINSFFKKNELSIKELYATLDYDKKPLQSCPRIAQLLYNDPVKIIEYRGDEVKIVTPQWNYSVKNKLCKHYWLQASLITPLTQKRCHYHPNNIPYKTTKQTIIVLTKPWHHKKTGQWFVPGTRFVLAHKKKSNKNYFKVFYTDPSHTHIVTIPTSHAREEELLQPTTARKLFIVLLTSWAHHLNKPIPYALGGSSYQGLNNPNTASPLLGFDCGKLITRAAQICGIPLYAGNSITLHNSLQQLTKNDVLKDGDIIYFPGHVIIISNVKKGLLLEARGYGSGYGIVHEIPFSEQFKDIKTTEDLMHAYLTKKKIIRLDKQGKKTEIIDKIILLKLY